MADDILKEARDAFKECQDAEKDNRRWALEDIKFGRLSEQWDGAIEKQREREGRPCLTINKLSPVIRQVVNDARQNRPSIKVHPVDDKADPETAKIISGLIRNIEACSNADVAYDTAVDNAVSGGFGYWRVNLDYAEEISADADYTQLGANAFEQDIYIKRVANPFSVYGDPYSTCADSSDWNTAFIVDRLSKAQFKRKYKGAAYSDFEAAEWLAVEPPWSAADTVMVAEYWKRSEVMKQIIGLSDGTVMLLEEFEKQVEQFAAMGATPNTPPRPIKCYEVKQYILNGVEELERTDWAGKYIPIVPVYGDELNVEGKRYFRSLIRDSKGAQQMYNFMRSATAELVALSPKAPFIGPKGAFKSDADKWATANRATHQYIEYDGPKEPTRQQFAGIPAGMVNESMMASDDIKTITGIHDASLGARSNETSGRAIMARQREGDVSTFHFIDNLTRAIRHTGKILIDLIPKVYSTERIVRSLGEDGSPQTATVNPSEETIAKLREEMGAKVRIHDLRVGKYDLVVSSGPSFTSRREEAATMMTELIRAYPDAAPYIIDLIAKNFDWPGADEIAERARKLLPAELQDDGGANPEAEAAKAELQKMAGMIQQLQQAMQQMETDKSIEMGKLQIDERKVQVEEFKAETERMTAVQQSVPLDQLPQLMAQMVAKLVSNPQELPQEEGQANRFAEPVA